MRPNRAGCVGWAAWLGLFALALNALVPIHLAFDLAHAASHASRHAALHVPDSAERRVLALLTGHSDAGHHHHDHGKQHGTNCAVCSSLASIAALALPVAPVLPLPSARIDAVEEVAASGNPHRVAAAFYRSRAPPVS